jgi:hypothetical protein
LDVGGAAVLAPNHEFITITIKSHSDADVAALHSDSQIFGSHIKCEIPHVHKMSSSSKKLKVLIDTEAQLDAAVFKVYRRYRRRVKNLEEFKAMLAAFYAYTQDAYSGLR